MLIKLVFVKSIKSTVTKLYNCKNRNILKSHIKLISIKSIQLTIRKVTAKVETHLKRTHKISIHKLHEINNS